MFLEERPVWLQGRITLKLDLFCYWISSSIWSLKSYNTFKYMANTQGNQLRLNLLGAKQGFILSTLHSIIYRNNTIATERFIQHCSVIYETCDSMTELKIHLYGFSNSHFLWNFLWVYRQVIFHMKLSKQFPMKFHMKSFTKCYE